MAVGGVTEEQREALLAAACEVRGNAYAPYSHYKVGAAVLGEDGQIYTGVNVENATYGLTICAERTAVFNAVTAGQKRIVAAAVCTENAGSPCGACRQILVEFGGNIPVWITNLRGESRQSTTFELLPDHFGPEHLNI
ncbi:MAG: cytidine deaminase [Candidatus Promineifilaceae bacterium]